MDLLSVIRVFDDPSAAPPAFPAPRPLSAPQAAVASASVAQVRLCDVTSPLWNASVTPMHAHALRPVRSRSTCWPRARLLPNAPFAAEFRRKLTTIVEAAASADGRTLALLEPHDEKGMTFLEIAHAASTLPKRSEALVTGPAGTVYLCHPFLIHAAQAHRGTRPRFMAQPPLSAKGSFSLDGPSRVERAIRDALHERV